MKTKSKPAPENRSVQISPELLELCRLAKTVPIRLIDTGLIQRGIEMPNIEYIDRHFKPRDDESLHDAVVRQYGANAANALLAWYQAVNKQLASRAKQ
jgi:hypothetical protein